MLFELKETFRFHYVIYNYIYSGLKIKYRRSFLGFMWSVAAPLMQNVIVGTVFYFLMRFNMPNYVVYLFSGSVIFNLISNVIVQSTTVMLANENYIKKIYVPKLVFVLQTVLMEFINFLLILFSLVLLGIFFKMLSFSCALFFLPVSLLIILLLLIGLATIISVTTVYFRDMLHIVPVGMQAIFFLTPVLYPISVVPVALKRVIGFNPLLYFVDLFRSPIYDQHIPHASVIIFCFFSGISIFFFGIFLLDKLNNRIVFKL